MRIDFLQYENSEDLKLIEESRTLCMNASSFQEIILGWIAEHRTAEIYPGDNPEGQPTVVLILSDSSVEIGECEVEVSEVRKAFPLIVSFSDPTMPWNAEALSSSQREELIEPWFVERDTRLKVTYDGDLYHNVASLDATTEMAMCYTISDHGNVCLSLIDQEESESYEGDAVARAGYISFGYEFMDSKTRCGWSEHCYAMPR